MAAISYSEHVVLLEGEEVGALMAFGGRDVPTAAKMLSVSMAHLVRDTVINLKKIFTVEEARVLLMALQGAPIYLNAPGRIAKDEIRAHILMHKEQELQNINKMILLKKVERLTQVELAAVEYWAHGYWAGPGTDGVEDTFFDLYAEIVGTTGILVDGPEIKQ